MGEDEADSARVDPQPPPKAGLKELLASYERSLIVTALEGAGWNQRRAAAALGLLPTTLLEKMRRLGIRSPARVRAPSAPPAPSKEGREAPAEALAEAVTDVARPRKAPRP